MKHIKPYKSFKITESQRMSEDDVIKLLKSEDDRYGLSSNIIQDITDLLFDEYHIHNKDKEYLKNMFREGSDSLQGFLEDLEDFKWFDYKLTPKILLWIEDFIRDWEIYLEEE